MSYLWVKHLHVTCVVASLSLFLLRGAWMIRDTLAAKGRWVRIVPHVIDTVLLTAGIALAVMIEQYPGTAGWLTAKVLGLIAYVLLGTVALKRGRTREMRIVAFVGALAVFGYIVAVAITKDPVPIAAAG